MLERTQVFRLRDNYQGKKSSGYDVDEETGAIIVYALDCVFYEGIYYSMEEGGPITFGSYVPYVRKYVRERPLQVPGTGVLVYRTNSEGKFTKEESLNLLKDLGRRKRNQTVGSDSNNINVWSVLYDLDNLELKLVNVYAGPKHITRYPNGDIVFHTVVVFKVEVSKCEKASHNFDKNETKEIVWMTIPEIEDLLRENKVFPNNVPILEDVVKTTL